MNKKIEYFTKKSKLEIYGIGKEKVLWESRLDHFVELIIKDCLEVVERKEYSYHEADPLWETAQLIKERFGIE